MLFVNVIFYKLDHRINPLYRPIRPIDYYILENNLLTLELLDQHISECKEHVEAGKEDPKTLEFFLSLRHDLEQATPEDWVAYNELSDHLPAEGADPVLIILKGQLLIEKLVRKFILSRLPNPEAFEKQQFSASHCIAIGESMCLKNKDPEWLWKQIKELNTIRNKLAHNLDYGKIEPRINNFVSTIATNQNLKNRTITSAIARLYGMAKGLCDLSKSNGFRAFTK